MVNAAEAPEQCDVVVVGAGPAGSAAAIRLAQKGCSVLLLESERFPRFHVGESLLPLGEAVFRELGVREQIAAAGFVEKFGAQLITASGAHTVLFDFAASTRVDPPSTFQVHRAEFDALLLQHALACGAVSATGRASDYRVDGDGVTVEWTDPDGRTHRVRGKALIDASGRAGFVARREGVRIADPELEKASIYAHFTGVPADPGRRGGDTRIVALPKLGWMWAIPLKNGVTSIGIVLDVADWKSREKGDPASIFAESIASAPAAARLLCAATRVSDFRTESGFSYRAERYCGERWFLAGDAGSFLDPVFSTGVLMALRSGLEAADAASAAYLQRSHDPASALRRFDARLQRRYRFVRRFVTGFYDPHTRDIFFAPRPLLGMAKAVTTVLAGGFDLGMVDRLRLRLFFLIGKLQRRYDLVPRISGRKAPLAAAAAER